MGGGAAVTKLTSWLHLSRRVHVPSSVPNRGLQLRALYTRRLAGFEAFVRDRLLGGWARKRRLGGGGGGSRAAGGGGGSATASTGGARAKDAGTAAAPVPGPGVKRPRTDASWVADPSAALGAGDARSGAAAPHARPAVKIEGGGTGPAPVAVAPFAGLDLGAGERAAASRRL